MTDLTGYTFFDGPAGRIEAILKEPDSKINRAAIVCHPHPLFGGTMHNKVVYRIARVFQDRGYAVLRFNFRGTGLSQGEHDYGNGEIDDLHAAIEFITDKYTDARIWLAGFSFGAAVMLRGACGEPRVKGMIAAGTPISKYDFSGVATCAKPKLFVQGEHDEYGAVADLERLVNQLPEPKVLQVIAGAEHFFEGKLAELASVISEFLARYSDDAKEKDA